jgi:hypothetical protein
MGSKCTLLGRPLTPLNPCKGKVTNERTAHQKILLTVKAMNGYQRHASKAPETTYGNKRAASFKHNWPPAI